VEVVLRRPGPGPQAGSVRIVRVPGSGTDKPTPLARTLSRLYRRLEPAPAGKPGMAWHRLAPVPTHALVRHLAGLAADSESDCATRPNRLHT